MVELKDRLQRSLNPAERKISTGMMNGAYNFAQQQQRQRYPSNQLVNKPATPTSSYYGHQDQFNSTVPAYPPRPTTPFQNNSWTTAAQSPPVNNYNSPPTVPSLPPMANVPPLQSQQQFQQQQAPLPPPPTTSMAPPPTSGNVSRVGPLTQRVRVYVQDPSVSSGRSTGYFNPGANTQFQQGSQMGYMTQPSQSNSTMFQPPPTQQFNNSSSYSQQGNFGANQFNQPLSNPTSSVFPQQSGSLSNGLGIDSAQQPSLSLYNPLDQVQAPQQQSAFMQPSPFDIPPSITPPLVANLVPSLPTLPATTAPPGWNDPPPLTSVAKPKAEAPAVETISQPIFSVGVVEQPAIPVIQPFDGSYNPAMPVSTDTIQQHQVTEPTPVQPAPACIPIPSEHFIIHDVFNTLKNKCSALASNAVRKLIFVIHFVFK